LKSGRQLSPPASPAVVYVLNRSVPRRPPPPISEAWSTVPSAASDSAGAIRIAVPAGTPGSSRSSGHPTMF
jgi:hypothetical protein